MIEGKILKFGYGDIAVQNKFTNMRLVPFKPPVEIGTSCHDLFDNGDIVQVGEAVVIKFDTLNDFTELKEKLRSVRNTTIKVFEFKGYIFDFSNYNEKSVEVVDSVLHGIYMDYLRCAAC
jgi:hypothetical protein